MHWVPRSKYGGGGVGGNSRGRLYFKPMIETVPYATPPEEEQGSTNNTANNYKNNKVFFNAAPGELREKERSSFVPIIAVSEEKGHMEPTTNTLATRTTAREEEINYRG